MHDVCEQIIKQKSVSNKPADSYHWRCEFKVDSPQYQKATVQI